MRTHIGHYEIVSELGRGGMGVVFKAFDPSLNRYVAIKMLAPMLIPSVVFKQRFLREAQSAAAILQASYSSTQWHSDSLILLSGEGLLPDAGGQNWLSTIYRQTIKGRWL